MNLLAHFLRAFGLGLTLLLAMAQTAWAQTAPVVRGFTVQQVAQLTPGTELLFRLSGTAGGAVAVRIDGSDSTVALREVRAGSYEGAYTLSLRDKVVHTSQVRATLRVGTLETQAVLGQTLLTFQAHAAAVVAAMPAPVIDHFASSGSGAYSGGHELTFTLRGTAGAQVGVALAGTDARIALAETEPGRYSGSYTIRTRDTITERSVAKVTLTLGGKTAMAEKTLAAPAVQPTLAARQSCAACGVVESVNLVEGEGQPGYTGAIAGGVAGAVLGNQIGKGDGRTVASILGAVGGAYAGREIEKRVVKSKRYDVTVRLHNGTVQTVQHADDPGVKVGQQVRISDGRVLVND